MFGLFGNTNYNKEADKLLLIINECIKILQSIGTSNNKNITSLRNKYKKATYNLTTVKNKCDSLEAQFKKTIGNKNPAVNKLPSNFAVEYISRSSNKYVVVKVPTIRYMQQIIQKFKFERNKDNKIKAGIKNANIKEKAEIAAAKKISNNAAALEAKKISNNQAASAKLISNAAEINRIKKGAAGLLNSAISTRRRINVANTVRNVLGTKPGGNVEMVNMKGNRL